jgi:hypothetical protein
LALDRYAERGADASERIGHQSDRGAVAQTGDGQRVDTVEQRAHFQGNEHRVCPDVTTCRACASIRPG